jgi:hypothetical protein
MKNPYSVIVIAHQQQRQFHEFKRKYIAGAGHITGEPDTHPHG